MNGKGPPVAGRKGSPGYLRRSATGGRSGLAGLWDRLVGGAMADEVRKSCCRPHQHANRTGWLPRSMGRTLAGDPARRLERPGWRLPMAPDCGPGAGCWAAGIAQGWEALPWAPVSRALDLLG